jgi:hypothetical protein
VLTDGPVSEFTLLKPSIGVRDLVRSGANLSSRVVENLFWLGRYSERFDDSARLLRVAWPAWSMSVAKRHRPWHRCWNWPSV